MSGQPKYNWQARLSQVREEVVEVLNEEFTADRVSDKAMDKLRHLFRVLDKFEADVERMAGTREALGGPAPAEAAVVAMEPYVTVKVPDISHDSTPQMRFVKLSFGKVNLDHVSLLDEETKTLHMGPHTRSIKETDLRKLSYHMQFYQDR